jgi:curved DNA-binding protein CbpA
LATLGHAPADASVASARRAYKKAALTFHPDRNGGKSAEERIRGEEVWKLLSQKYEEYNEGSS